MNLDQLRTLFLHPNQHMLSNPLLILSVHLLQPLRQGQAQGQQPLTPLELLLQHQHLLVPIRTHLGRLPKHRRRHQWPHSPTHFQRLFPLQHHLRHFPIHLAVLLGKILSSLILSHHPQ
jgi:hypothetical protein